MPQDNRSAMRKTIVARIATFDTSIPNPTEEQVTETLRLLVMALELYGGQPDGQTLGRIKAELERVHGVEAPGGNNPPEAAPAPPEGPAREPPPEEGAPGTRNNERGGEVSTSVKARALNYVKGAKPEMEAVVDRVVDALVPAEGFADNDTVGDEGRAVGTLQMWDDAVAEANRIVGRELWTSEDRKDPALARAMAKVTLSFHYRRGVTDPVELGAKWRNPYGKEAPEWYKAKLRKALAENEKPRP
jgi:hypothetical protein